MLHLALYYVSQSRSIKMKHRIGELHTNIMQFLTEHIFNFSLILLARSIFRVGGGVVLARPGARSAEPSVALVTVGWSGIIGVSFLEIISGILNLPSFMSRCFVLFDPNVLTMMKVCLQSETT